MSESTIQTIQLALSALNVLVIPVLFGVGRWLVRVELRLARLEWTAPTARCHLAASDAAAKD